MSKYLDLQGLTYFWSKIKAKLDNVLQAYNISTIANSSSTTLTQLQWDDLVSAIDAHKTFYSINSSTMGYTGWEAYKDQYALYFTHIVGTTLNIIRVDYLSSSSIYSSHTYFNIADADSTVSTSSVV
jgi:hypothetical protein